MINRAGQDLVTASEKIMLTAYLCPAGVPTNGRGHTKGITHKMVQDKFTITAAQEQIQFEQDMLEWEADVRKYLTREPNENQIAAMVSLAFNIGLAGFATSSVLKAFNRGDDQAAARAFGLWNKITDPATKNKVVSNGLSIRRSKEAALYLTPVAEPANAFFPTQPSISSLMPQAVEPPKPMTSSGINRGAVVAGGTATVAAVTESINTVNSLKSSIHDLGDWVVPLLLIVTVISVGYIMWERYNQRNRGDA